MKKRKLKTLTKKDLELIFRSVDEELVRKNGKNVEVLLIGAASILMLDVLERGTVDIDVAPLFDAPRFARMVTRMGVPVDLVSVTSTVDFQSAARLTVFEGAKLHVTSVNEADLIKLKLERFRKQDPADIEAIIKKFSIDYGRYKEIVLEAVRDYVGHPRTFCLGALQVAANCYLSDQVKELEQLLEKF